MVIWTAVRPTASVCRVIIGKNCYCFYR